MGLIFKYQHFLVLQIKQLICIGFFIIFFNVVAIFVLTMYRFVELFSPSLNKVSWNPPILAENSLAQLKSLVAQENR